ncbi:hypothetical protein G1C95_0004 [Bifidobacterium sp. DSM 109957]|uniref:Uncharacterized protein n=1 Tax=Bifidobacterium oedipodis TaxID=2675322 RepID=A0A7Y0EM60_9BIFI|nr:hypothetical protein [Bifidobacterium sp. DSM 109957]
MHVITRIARRNNPFIRAITIQQQTPHFSVPQQSIRVKDQQSLHDIVIIIPNSSLSMKCWKMGISIRLISLQQCEHA